MAVDMDRMQEFLGRFAADLGATVGAGSIVIGHRPGLYRALADVPANADELAAATQTSPRYLAEWLRGQAAGDYVEYDPATGAGVGWREHDEDVFTGSFEVASAAALGPAPGHGTVPRGSLKLIPGTMRRAR